jgi:hypothetical protein
MTFLPLILTLLFALVLFLLVKDFLKTVIIEPLLFVFWFLTLLLESIPQGVIWVIFILIMMIIAISGLRKNEEKKWEASNHYNPKMGKVEKWARILDHAQKDKFTKWRLANELKRLTKKIVNPEMDHQKSMRRGVAVLPSEISDFFEAQQPIRTSIWDWLNRNDSTDPNSALDLDPEIVIQYLEEQRKP